MTLRGTDDVEYSWRGDFTNDELNMLHAEAFGHAVGDDDWRGQVERYSLGWVCARRGGELIGWVNVAWDGGVHAFISTRWLRTMLDIAASAAGSSRSRWSRPANDRRHVAIGLRGTHGEPVTAITRAADGR